MTTQVSLNGLLERDMYKNLKNRKKRRRSDLRCKCIPPMQSAVEMRNLRTSHNNIDFLQDEAEGRRLLGQMFMHNA